MSFIEDLGKRILVLDGAMGTMIQRRFIGDNETLNIDDPDYIKSIHKEFIDAGADIIETNSFGANRISQKEYGMASKARTMALRAAQIAREAASEAGRTVYVAGSVGPTGESLTLPSDASDLTFRKYSFEEMVDVYTEQISALVEGGVDFILIETCYDALVTKAIIYALEQMGNPLPVVISVTVSDRSGRTLTGQTVEAFYTSIMHCPRLAAFGINCALGASQMKGLVTEIASFSSHPIIFYPNAGLPDEMGIYSERPQVMASVIKDLAEQGLINIAGGCCGTRPEHIRAVAAAVGGLAPGKVREASHKMTVSGLETVTVDRSNNFMNIGERTNVAGSRKFARLISEGSYQEALAVAADQIAGGADIIDINMDDAMLDSKVQMRTFLRYIASDPAVGKAAIMIDSSHFETIMEGLRNAQGRCIVNSISLKDGKEEFLRRARFIKDMGAAMVVMAFDENGQAETFDRKVQICSRSYDLLVNEAGVCPEDIIFDVNILSIGTGIASHARFAVDFIEAVRWIKEELPGAYTSGGVSNLSFAFRGKNNIREAMHSAFLYHAIAAGLDMAIVNPQMLQVYDSIDPELLKLVEDLIFDRGAGATDALVAYAASSDTSAAKQKNSAGLQAAADPQERLCAALVKGGSPTLEQDILNVLSVKGDAVGVIEGPLMRGMEQVGELFASGKMFLPQVVRSAKVMQDAVAILRPYMKAEHSGSARPKIVIATVKGDVHDIGKNITSIVLQCSGFEVIDLGVMVPSEDILAKARDAGADIVAVSGLITPSLFRMEELCKMMSAQGFSIPLFVGGAAASAVHTAVKLAPLYPDVHYGADASASAVMAKKYMSDPVSFHAGESALHARMRALRESAAPVPEAAIGDGFCTDVCFNDIGPIELPATDYLRDFDWKTFNAVCRVPQDSGKFADDARSYLTASGLSVRYAVRFFDCFRDGDAIVSSCGKLRFPMLRQGSGARLSLCDFFPDRLSGATAPLGLFAIAVDGDNSEGLVEHAVRVTVAETASARIQKELGEGLHDGLRLIAPGIGYACCPDHSLKKDVLAALPDVGISLTDSCSMIPEASICGLIIAHKDAAYHSIREVLASELDAYSNERGFTAEQKSLFLNYLQVK